MNPSSFDPDDQKLTAYALGELPDVAERAAVEQLLADSPEARASVEEIRSFAAWLVAEYNKERQQTDHTGATAADSLPPVNVVEFAPQNTSRRVWSTLNWWKIAATVVVLATLGLSLFPAYQRVNMAAHHSVQQNSTPSSMEMDVESPEPEPVVVAQTPAPAAAAVMPMLEHDEVASVNPPAQTDKLKSSEASDNRLAQQEPPISLSGSPAISSKPAFPATATPGKPVLGKDKGAVAPMVAAAKSANALSTGSARLLAPSEDFTPESRTRKVSALPKLALIDGRTLSPGILAGAVSSNGSVRLDDKEESRTPAADSAFNTATYDHVTENPFLAAKENPLSTFSIDVDTASYSNVRRFIEAGSLPPKDAVRIEEMLNYFPYTDAPPAEGDPHPFAIHLEAAGCPWNLEHRLVRIGIKGREIAQDKRPASNLVFLIDVSGSMMPRERLPLIKASLRLLVEKLSEDDHVAIVVYAGHSGLALPSTSGDHKSQILAALDRLEAGGSTNGADGIQLAYKVARENFIKGGVNRVILATDGDFNVGTTSQGELIRLIEKEAKSGVFLSALGVGTDNYKDSTMQKLADRGNGNYAYIDRLEEGRKVLVEQMNGTLVTIAKDVKIQVEFNPAAVASYRLIGYEKRMLRKEDFNNDKIDAGEIGAGHTVTALYEIVPAGRDAAADSPAVDSLKYQSPAPAPSVAAPAGGSAELLTIKMRYKAPDADNSVRSYDQSLVDKQEPGDFAKASADFKFSAAVAGFGLVLRDSPNKGNLSLGAVVELAQDGKGADASGYRAQFIDLVRRADRLADHARDAR